MPTATRAVATLGVWRPGDSVASRAGRCPRRAMPYSTREAMIIWISTPLMVATTASAENPA